MRSTSRSSRKGAPRSASSPTSRVFLHIGAPMTGSSYIRDCLARHWRRLARSGVLYPPSHLGHDGGHLDAVLDVLELSTTGRAQSIGAWDRVAETARDWRRGTVVVSHELLSDASQEQVKRAVSSFGNAEVHVVYATCGLARQIPLAWQEWVRNGGTASFATYVNRVVARDPHRMSKVFWQSHDLGEVLDRWSAFVPGERIHVLTVPDSENQDAVLWDRFAQTIGIDPRKFKAGSDSRRVPLGLAENEVLRLLNRQTGQAGDPQRLERVRRALGAGRGTRPALSVVHAEWLSEETDRLVGAVKDGGYAVVGDTCELVAGPDALAVTDDHVIASTDSVLAAQTRTLAALAGLTAHAQGPAGLHRRALRELASVSRLRRR